MSDPYDFAHPYSSLTPHVLAPFVAKHRVFIETGSNNGHGIQAALDAGFEIIHELIECRSRGGFEVCADRFTDRDRVVLCLGDSPVLSPRDT